KVSATGFDAFASPNFSPLGVVGVDIAINWDLLWPRSKDKFNVSGISSMPYVGQIRLFPGIPAKVIENFLQPPIQGVILETYGTGNAPDKDKAFLDVLRAATDRGVVLVSCTQCLQGTVNLAEYATGSALKNAGVISGFDMTPEAAL